MIVRVMVTLHEGEDAMAATVFAICKELGVECESGDIDGRHWVDIKGVIDEAGLREIVSVINKSSK